MHLALLSSPVCLQEIRQCIAWLMTCMHEAGRRSANRLRHRYQDAASGVAASDDPIELLPSAMT
jgi:hypothetical protein